jgi:hypothetical protein
MKLISDILGILGILISVVVYQQKKRERMLASKLVLDLVWLLHYCFIGAYSGAAVAAIAAFRELVYVKRDTNNKKGIIWLPTFIVIAVLCTVLTWNGIFSLFTCFASCIAVVSFFIGNPRLSRILAFPVSVCLLTYDVACHSVAGVINETLAMLSSAVGIWRHDRKRTLEAENTAQKA